MPECQGKSTARLQRPYDTGTQVSRIYDGPFPFVGKLDRVVIKLTE